jgi:BASS family bile acid:Na+ symporter
VQRNFARDEQAKRGPEPTLRPHSIDLTAMLIPFQWIGLFATAAVFAVMFALGLMLGREQVAAVLRRPLILASVVFAVVAVVPTLAVLALKAFAVTGPVAVGIILMAISPGAPVALRRALDAGASPEFAPALHLAIVASAVLTVPASVAILDWIFAAEFTVTPWHIARQVFFAQLLPMALGALLRAVRPAFAARVEAPLVRIGNALLLALAVMVLIDMRPILAAVGWTPILAGAGVTVGALVVGSAFAWRNADVRTAAAIAAAMRNPGLALVIATLNRAPPAVTAAVVGYALGLGVTLVVYLRWHKPR